MFCTILISHICWIEDLKQKNTNQLAAHQKDHQWAAQMKKIKNSHQLKLNAESSKKTSTPPTGGQKINGSDTEAESQEEQVAL